MTTKKTMGWLKFICLLAMLGMVNRSFAGNYNWDANGSEAGSGGTGTWDVVSALWTNAPNTWVSWPNSNPNADTALFSGVPGGVVTIAPGQTIYVNAMKIGTTSTVNYRFTGGDVNSVLAFSGTEPKVYVGVNNMTLNNGNAPTFTNLTINTGSGVTFLTSAGHFVFSGDSRFTGSGLVTIGITNVGGWFGSTSYLQSTNNAGFSGGFAVNSLSALCTETLLSALAANSLGTGRTSVSGLSRLLYGWGAQAPNDGSPVGVTAATGGVIDLTGSYNSTHDRFALASGGVLRGSASDLSRVAYVKSFSGSPTQPEVILEPSAVVASTTPTSSQTVQNLPANANLYFGLGTTFDSAAFTLNMGEGTPWKGLANDTQVGVGTLTSRRLSAGTITLTPSSRFSEIAFQTQGRGPTKAKAEQPWAGNSFAGYQYPVLVLGNNTAVPTFSLASGSAIPARIMNGSCLALDGAGFAPAAISHYIISEGGFLLSTRSQALNGYSVDNEGGVLALNPNYLGSPAGAVDTVGTLTVARHSRLYVGRKTAGTPETLVITNLVRSGNAVLEICNATAGQLGGDEKIKLVNASSLVRGKIVAPYLIATGTAATDASVRRYDFLVQSESLGLGTNLTYDATWGNGNIVTGGVLAVSGTVNVDSLRLDGGNITNGATSCTINLGILPDGSRAAQAGILNSYSSYGNTINPAVNVGAGELVVYLNNEGGFLSLKGAVSAGALTKNGLRELQMNNASNAISGPVSIWGGTLNVTGGNGPGPQSSVMIGGLGTWTVGTSLSVTGLGGVGTLSISSGKTNFVTGILSAGQATASLTATSGGTLSLGTNALASFDLDYINTPTGTPRLAMSGTALNVASGASVTLNALANRPTGRYEKTFVLVQYGALTGSFRTKVNAPEGVEAQLVYDDLNKTISLYVQNKPQGLVLMVR